MNKQEFMESLENLLQNIPEQERIEALQYYNDYFDDAGAENEQAVLSALGTPAQVAENIKRDLNQNRYAYGEEQDRVSLEKEIVKYQPEMQEGVHTQTSQKKRGLSTGGIVILCVLASPVLLTILFLGIFIVLMLLIGWIALIGWTGITMIASFGGGIVGVMWGTMFICMQAPLLGVAIMGFGFLIAAFGILCLMFEVLLVGKLTPAIFKGIRRIFRRLTGKNKAV